MATEEQNKPFTAPKPAPAAQESNAGNGDMAHLIGNVGILIDSAVESVQGVISSVSTATGQLIEGVTTTINSEPVKEILNNVNSATGQLIEGVTATLKSEPVQNSFHELGKFWEGLISNLNSTVNSDQVKNLFDNVSSGMSQLVSNVFSSAMPPVFLSSSDEKKRPVQQIHFVSPKETAAPVKVEAPATPAVTPAAPATAPVAPAAVKPENR
jgi:chlorosome envelope protein H